MTAPTTTVRTQPSGIYNGIPDGFGAKIAFNAHPGLEIWEKKVKPYSMDGGDPVDQTTNWNTRVRTKSARVLFEFQAITVEAGYDPDSYSDLVGMMNAEQSITVTWRTGDKLDFYGALRKVEPSDMEDANKPMISLTIEFTNRDSTGAEVMPVYTAAAGT